MSVLVTGLRLPVEQPIEEAIPLALARCNLLGKDAKGTVYRHSIDARHGRLSHVVSVLLEMDGQTEQRLLTRMEGRPDVRRKALPAELCATGEKQMKGRPVIVGFGPAGMFAALALSRAGYRPLVLERGPCLEERDRATARFFEDRILDENANVQFGEGGAGAYSDGKLTTRISDPLCEYVLNEMVAHGAPEATRQDAKPHIGTDLLKGVVRSIREEITSAGGEVRFCTPVTEFILSERRIKALRAGGETIPCEICILAIGHSARDSFLTLRDSGVSMTKKAFSVGVRIEHLQSEINRALYGKFSEKALLPPGEYALSCRMGDRGIYTFCMCPGGQVIPAASEQGGVVVNGMSRHARDGKNANAALVVSVGPEDFPGNDPLAGVAFQREIEQKAYRATGGYRAPVSTVGAFLSGKVPDRFGRVRPTYAAGTEFCEIKPLFPDFVGEGLAYGIRQFGRKIKGFDAPDSVLTAPETRTSSPIRMLRGESMTSVSADGLIPCGEGAGYAGGIMSAAVDGLRAARRIMEEYRPFGD